jgi:hypothetical protein
MLRRAMGRMLSKYDLVSVVALAYAFSLFVSLCFSLFRLGQTHEPSEMIGQLKQIMFLINFMLQQRKLENNISAIPFVFPKVSLVSLLNMPRQQPKEFQI